jgi:hypothetical protein
MGSSNVRSNHTPEFADSKGSAAPSGRQDSGRHDIDFTDVDVQQMRGRGSSRLMSAAARAKARKQAKERPASVTRGTGSGQGNEQQADTDGERSPNLLTAALNYARQGIRVFPVYGIRPDGICQCGDVNCPNPGKHPRTRQGLSEGTTSEPLIRKWWGMWPDANIGGRTGSRLVVFDPDGAEGLPEAVRHGMDLDGPHSTSRPGHAHYFFRPPRGVVLQNQTKKQGRWPFVFCDARGEGGYVVLPPSRHVAGTRYTWSQPLDVEKLPAVPAALLGVWKTPPDDPRASETVWDEADGVWVEVEEAEDNAGVGFETARYFLARYLRDVEEGADRNSTGLLLALQLRDAPLTYDDAVPFMRRFQAAVETARPDKADYDWKEAERTLKQAYTRQRRDRVQFQNQGDWQQGTSSGNGDQARGRRDQDGAAMAWPKSMADAGFYGVLGRIAREVEPHIEADSGALLLNLLAASGIAIGHGPYLQIGAARHYGVLYVVTVGETGGNKSDGTTPLTTIFAAVKDLPPVEYTPEGLRADVDFSSLGEPRTLRGLSTGEGLLFQIRDDRKSDKLNKDTHEPEVIPGIKDKRLLALEAEFARVLAVMSRDGNTLGALLRDLYDSPPTAETSTKSEPIRVTAPHVGLLAQITPAELHRKLGEIELSNGFVNRFLWPLTHRIKSLPRPPDYSDLAREHAARWRDAVARAATVGAVAFDAEAAALWEAQYELLREGGREGLPPREGMAKDVCARAHVAVLRIALIFAALDGSPLITAAHLDAALACWDYCERCAAYLFGDVAGDPVENVIARALKERRKMTRNDVMNLYGRHRPSAAIQTALDALLTAGKVRTFQEPTNGRPAEWWEWIGGEQQAVE